MSVVANAVELIETLIPGTGGPAGATGATGAAGPNLVSTGTSTNNGTVVAPATVAGIDLLAAPDAPAQREKLGLGTAATASASAFDPAGSAAAVSASAALKAAANVFTANQTVAARTRTRTLQVGDVFEYGVVSLYDGETGLYTDAVGVADGVMTVLAPQGVSSPAGFAGPGAGLTTLPAFAVVKANNSGTLPTLQGGFAGEVGVYEAGILITGQADGLMPARVEGGVGTQMSRSLNGPWVTEMAVRVGDVVYLRSQFPAAGTSYATNLRPRLVLPLATVYWNLLSMPAAPVGKMVRVHPACCFQDTVGNIPITHGARIAGWAVDGDMYTQPIAGARLIAYQRPSGTWYAVADDAARFHEFGPFPLASGGWAGWRAWASHQRRLPNTPGANIQMLVGNSTLDESLRLNAGEWQDSNLFASATYYVNNEAGTAGGAVGTAERFLASSASKYAAAETVKIRLSGNPAVGLEDRWFPMEFFGGVFLDHVPDSTERGVIDAWLVAAAA